MHNREVPAAPSLSGRQDFAWWEGILQVTGDLAGAQHRRLLVGAVLSGAVEKGANDPMQMTVYGKNIEVTPALREYLEKKMRRIERITDQPVSGQANFTLERGRYIVEVTLPLNGMLVRGEEINPDPYASVDLVVDKLEKQVERYKKARLTRKRITVPVPTAGEALGDEEEYRVVRVKRFPLKPQTVDEAVLQMDLLGHDFFVFHNAETMQINVVYRRRDGDYGLLEPDR